MTDRLREILADAIPPAPAGWNAEKADLRADLLALRDRIAAGEFDTYRVCGVTEPHVVHPQHWEHGGWGTCGNCLGPVYIDAATHEVRPFGPDGE